jgi:DNA-binding MarR family transcriptional regulator
VNRKLKRRGGTFTQWRFLHAAELLVEELGDMVSQQEIGRRAGIDENTASALMQRLARKGWLSVGIGGPCNAYRLFVTDAGKAFLAVTRRLILAAGMETWQAGCTPSPQPTSFAP